MVKDPYRTCPFCGKPYRARAWNQKWCSQKCSLDAAEARWRERDREVTESISLREPQRGRRNRNGRRIEFGLEDQGPGGRQVLRNGRWVKGD